MTLHGRLTLFTAAAVSLAVRVVIPVLDKTPPTVAARLDATFRTLGGVPTNCLTDNEKTVTVEHVARIAVRNPELVPIARYYGTVVRSCMPADPASKGGTEATVRIAKRDLVPTAVNLRPEYAGFAELQEACECSPLRSVILLCQRLLPNAVRWRSDARPPAAVP
ncbi:hypothetical protein GCM10010430_76480 [Kitasatospora cystarginea]|uniref:Integrase catalytic domain-containing protein n=1 Tax=Kitasatospora cystarginea TaxID=58350 RepID=A0ABN3EZZ1_9ACTN